MPDAKKGFDSADDIEDSGISGHLSSKRYCKILFDDIVGLSAYENTYLVQGQNQAITQKRSFIEKSDDEITGYRIGFSSKNPGEIYTDICSSTLFLLLYSVCNLR